MPITNPANAILAKSRAMYGKRLMPHDFNELLHCQTVTEVAAYLKTKTKYAGVLTNINEGTVHRGQLETALRVKLFEDFASLCRYELTVGEDFSEYIIMKGEIEQILHFLRLLLAGHPEEYLFSLPVFFSKHSTVDLYELARTRTPAGFFRAINSSRYVKVLAPFASNDSAFDFTGIENALFSYMFNTIGKLINTRYHGTERKELNELIGAQIDLLNFAHIYRLKRYFNAAPDYIRSLLFPNTTIPKPVLEAMITTPKSDDVMEIMLNESRYGKYLNSVDYSYIDDFVSQVKFRLAKRYIRFSVNPSVVLFSYVILLESEIEDIINIIEGVRYKLSPEEISTLIISDKKITDKGESDWQ